MRLTRWPRARGRVVVVEGPAGIGKTSLLDLGPRAAQERSFAVASARGSELEVAYAWGVVRQLFEPRLRGMSPRRAAGRSPAPPRWRRRSCCRTRRAAGRRRRRRSACSTVCTGSSPRWRQQRPQLLVVDDLHWADGASVRFLEFLANRLDALPALLLAAQRPAAATADGALRGAPLATSIELAPLSLGGDGRRARRARRRAGLRRVRPGVPRRHRRQSAADPPAGGGLRDALAAPAMPTRRR